jgi:DNA repair exonuclease SbcCD ATPase subunit
MGLDPGLDHMSVETLNIDPQQLKQKMKLIESQIKQARDAKVQLQSIDKQIKTAESKLNKIQTEIDKLSTVISYLKTELEEHEKKLATQNSIVKEKNTLTRYLSCIDAKNGIPFKILCNIIKDIERNANQTLSQLSAGFHIQFTTGKDIQIETIIDTPAQTNIHPVSLECCSGFQRFAVSIAIRICLAHVLPGTIGDLLIVDEGFSCLDASNLENAKRFLTELKNQFKLIIIISHMEAMNACLDTPIFITRADGISSIKHGRALVHAQLAPSDSEESPKQTPVINTATAIQNGLYHCDICGATVKFSSKKAHLKTKKHVDAVNNVATS